MQLYQKETPTQVFFCEYREIFKNTHFEKHLQTIASVDSRAAVFQEFALPLKRNALTSGICNLDEFCGHRFKLEAKDLIFHILHRNFPNFGPKILAFCSARGL